ncbi:MAG TPA: DUF1592 domain-containing protein [Gammaproteobacteria bacterium]
MRRRIRSASLVVAAAVACGGCEPSREALIAEHSGTLERYCVGCHGRAERAGGFSLEGRSLDAIGEEPALWEKVARKLRAGVMPPAHEPRPDRRTYRALASWIEGELDRTLVPRLPPPGLHRLNRAEYGNVIRDLLALDVEPERFLPPDDSSHGFDNQAGTLSPSPALLEAYLSAAGKISRLALGHVSTPTQTVYRVAEDATQRYHVEGLPFGTRGGILIDHYFPADGEYVVEVFPVTRGMDGSGPFGEVRGEQLEVLVDGARVALLDWDEALGVEGPFGGGELPTIDVRVPITAGPHRVGVTFLATNYAPLLDINDPFERSTIETGGLPGFTFYPHVGAVRIDGPYDAQGVSDTPSRRAIFSCRPESEAQWEPCAREILTRLARLAYRGTATPEDVDALLELYARGAANGFEAGIELALQRLLVSPKFLYRIEIEPENAAPGEAYRVSDVELASRLSFFLWSSIPDDELLTLAEQGRLADPAVLEQQVRRMLADPRSAALTENFAGQWLDLRALDSHEPVVEVFPDFDDNLRRAFRRETELFFDSLLRENRSVLELLTADYTFVNERLARHYGIPGVRGSRFRRVTLGPGLDARRGLLGKGSFLTVSSQPGRTSPVVRGYWVLKNLLGVTPPPPPPDVPALDAGGDDRAGGATQPPIRERMERHRDNPACSGCHLLTDTIGYALEPFDAVGRERTQADGAPIDASVELYDGTVVNGPAGVREFVLEHSEQFVRTVTEKLLAYAIGRGLEYSDMPFVRQIAREAAADDYRLQSLILALVRSAPFAMSTKSLARETHEDGGTGGAVEPQDPGEGVEPSGRWRAVGARSDASPRAG